MALNHDADHDLAKADESKSTSSSVSTAILSKAKDVSTLPDVDADGRSSSTASATSFGNCFNQPALTETAVEESPEAKVTASDSGNFGAPTAEAKVTASDSGNFGAPTAEANFEKCEPVSSATSQPTCGEVDDPGGAYLSPHAIQLPDFTRMDRTSALVDYVWYPKAGPAGMDLLIVIIKYEYYTEDTLKAVDVLVEFMRQEIHSDFVSIFDISEMAIPSLFSMPWLLSLGRERQPEFTIFRQCQQSFTVIRGNSYLFNTLVDTLVVLSGAETAPNFATDQAEALTMLNKLS